MPSNNRPRSSPVAVLPDIAAFTMSMDQSRASANKEKSLNECEALNNRHLNKKLTFSPPSRYFQVCDPEAVCPPMVKIFVGSERKLWILPEQLLCDRLEYFKSAFQSGFQESKNKVLELPEDDPTAFAFILDRILGIENPQISDWGDDFEARQLIWCKIEVLADKIGCSSLVLAGARCYDEFRAVRRERMQTPWVSAAAAKFLYENITDASSMRDTLAHIMLSRHILEHMEDSELERWIKIASSHPKFHLDIMVKFRDHISLSFDECPTEFCLIH
jgi:hypothetical protein